MTYFLINFIKAISTIYAHLCIDMLFIVSLLLGLDFMEKSFQHFSLINSLIYLFIGFIPLFIWQTIQHIVFRKQVKFYSSRNHVSNIKFYFGLICISFTIVSIFKDVQLVKTGQENFFPAGILGKFFDFVIRFNYLHSHPFSGWLIFRYLLVALFIYSSLSAFTNSVKLNMSMLMENKRHEKTIVDKQSQSQSQKTKSNGKSNGKLNGKSKTKPKTKKFNYIE